MYYIFLVFQDLWENISLYAFFYDILVDKIGQNEQIYDLKHFSYLSTLH